MSTRCELLQLGLVAVLTGLSFAMTFYCLIWGQDMQLFAFLFFWQAVIGACNLYVIYRNLFPPPPPVEASEYATL